MASIFDRIAESDAFQLVVAVFVYALYGTFIGLSLIPSAVLFAVVHQGLGGLFSGESIDWAAVVLYCLTAGGAVFVFCISVVVFFGASIRILSLGIKPGSYPTASFTMLRWLIYSGLYNIVVENVIPTIVMSGFSKLFFQLMGAKIGRNVQINTNHLNDCYLMTIEDDVVIGGQTDVSCHLYENGILHLKPIHIGRGTQIGADCYIGPGVSIGAGSIIGLKSYIRQGKVLPPGTRLTSVGGVDFPTARRLERGLGPEHNGRRPEEYRG